MSNSVLPHRRQPARLPRPWDSPGKNTGVGCHFLLQCMKVKSKSEVAQSCPTLATPWTAAQQAPPSMGFSRQEYQSGVPLPSPKESIAIKKSKQQWPSNTAWYNGLLDVGVIGLGNSAHNGLLDIGVTGLGFRAHIRRGQVIFHTCEVGC